MWCKAHGEVTQHVVHDAYWGWLHYAKGGWHTVGGLYFDDSGKPRPATVILPLAALAAVAADGR